MANDKKFRASLDDVKTLVENTQSVNGQVDSAETEAPVDTTAEQVNQEQIKIDVPEPAPVPEVKPTVVVESPKAQVSDSKYTALIVKTIKQFCEDMKPGKPISFDTGARQEQFLFNQLLSVLNNCPIEEFGVVWSAVIDEFFDPTNGALEDRYIFRFAPYWTLSNDRCMAFQSIVNLIKLSKDSGKIRKQVDMDRALACLDENARNKIFSFYKL